MTTGEQGRTVPDAENYLDLSDVEDDSPGPHFDVVLRGYDRRQVDEHVAGLRRMVAQLRAQLAVHDRRRTESDAETAGGLAGAIPQARVASGQGDPEAGDGETDTVGAFNDRLQGILQAAEQEAQAVRSRAAETLLAEHAESRAALAELRTQRDGIVDELVRLRGWLDEIVSHPGRTPSAPPPAMGRAPRPWGAPPPGGPPPSGQPPSGQPPMGYGGPPAYPPPPAPPSRPVRGRPWPERAGEPGGTGVAADTLAEGVPATTDQGGAGTGGDEASGPDTDAAHPAPEGRDRPETDRSPGVG